MPLYDYRCTVCGALTPLIRPVTLRATHALCATCGAVAHVVFSAPRVQNLTASGDSLRTYGKDLRVDPGGGGTMNDAIARQRASRQLDVREGRAAKHAAERDVL